jgi:hypothetical protein
MRRSRALWRGRLNPKQAKDFPASCDDPIKLSDEFEAQYETKEYEAKISRLLRHEDPQE